MKSKRFISLSLMFGLTAGLFAGILSNRSSDHVEVVEAAGWTAYTHYDGATYYNGISDTLTGTSLTSALRSLNNSKKKKNGGYKALLNSDFWARYTDFDSESSYSQDTTHDLPYSTKIVSFYSGNVSNNASGMNREHVWPNSKGGSLVEEDSHMARPTLTSENSSRGNSFYVEGKKDRSKGWDPAMETWGDETYRGDAARIIFYCAIANESLTLVDKETDLNDNKTMGKLSDMLRWNLAYSVQQREMNRNEAVEAIQGNRNPFIDHPEYACKIWGDTNSATREACGIAPQPSISISKVSATLEVSETTTISASSSDYSQITWSTSDENVVSLSSSTSASGNNITLTAIGTGSATVTAKATISGTEYSKTCQVTVNGGAEIESISLNVTEKTLKPSDRVQLRVTITPSDAKQPEFVWSSSNESVATVDKNGLVTAVGVGDCEIVVKTSDDKFSAKCVIHVNNGSAPSGCGGNVITTSIILSTLSLLGVGILLIKRKFIK